MPSDFQEILASPTSAYEEGLRFFRGQGMVNDTLLRLVADLEAHEIEYSVIGAVALNQHGYRRFTEDIDLLMSKEGLEKFRDELVGKGYRPAYQGASRKFRETARNVPIEIITSGEYPGDGKPKPIQFHEPGEHCVVIDGVKTVELPKLIELKLASGMSGLGRLRDLADVQELIRVRHLDESMAARLDPSVRAKYLELHGEIMRARAQEMSPREES
ncbi:MAG: nucleotidyltransferase family protein [Acidobacteriota bacterium]|nr:nucleotidyltransferase family protein [Acidobacteriota bacterium]